MNKVHSIAIVSHCWCPPGTDDYAQMLKHQFASIARYTYESVRVNYIVCCNEDDEATMSMIEHCKSLPNNTFVAFEALQLERELLFRRAIGRNIASLMTDCDVVWYADVDMLFGGGALLEACRQVTGKPGLFMPEEVQISFDNFGKYQDQERPHHHVGQAMLDAHRETRFPTLNPSLFGGPWTGKAIGGVQIVSGETARKHGYLHGTRWVKPVSVEEGFRSCRCDRAYRVWLKELGVPETKKLKIPSVYRIRHLRDGRDYTLSGEKVGKEVW